MVGPKQNGIWTLVVRPPVLDVEKTMLNNIGLPGLLLIAVVVLVLFGRGKISSLMGEVGKGITSFKKGINEGEEDIKNARKQLLLFLKKLIEDTNSLIEQI